mmetsp:Transcript_82987/g.234774  ORF Transcript_82987/g.234774 Transcript_82987/m.234774 type:complete len:263 (+) Transcript_82987:468-1256(+)
MPVWLAGPRVGEGALRGALRQMTAARDGKGPSIWSSLGGQVRPAVVFQLLPHAVHRQGMFAWRAPWSVAHRRFGPTSQSGSSTTVQRIVVRRDLGHDRRATWAAVCLGMRRTEPYLPPSALGCELVTAIEGLRVHCEGWHHVREPTKEHLHSLLPCARAREQHRPQREVPQAPAVEVPERLHEQRQRGTQDAVRDIWHLHRPPPPCSHVKAETHDGDNRKRQEPTHRREYETSPRWQSAHPFRCLERIRRPSEVVNANAEQR